MEARSPQGKRAIFQTWNPSQSALLGREKLIALADDRHKRAIFLPLSALAELVPARASWIGEGHALVEALPPEEAAALLDKTAPFEVFPLRGD